MAESEMLSRLLEYRAELLGFIRAMVRDPHEAEDLFQEVALAIVKQAGAKEAVLNFQAWSKQVARHHVWNYYRRERNQKTIRMPEEEMVQIIDRAFSVSAPTSVELTEEYEALLQCIRKLPENTARMVRNRFITGTDYGKLAVEFKMKPNAIRQAVLRARIALVRCVTAQLGGSFRKASV